MQYCSNFISQISEDDRHRFKVADLNNDGALDHKEYVAYLQPYDYPHMYEVEMDRSMSDLDKDKDGYVSKQEFIDGRLTLAFHLHIRLVLEM